ncbi:MAG TPA: cell division protein FtsA [Patescibacteria group bacterium]
MARQHHAGHISVGLDIGTSKIAICIGTLQEGIPTILGMSKSPSAGIRKGVVSDIEETISALSAALAAAERIAGLPIHSATVGIEGAHITTTNSKGVVAVNRSNSEINPEDTHRAIEAARAVALPPNQEILHILPRLFSVDGLQGVKDPSGMVGIRLEVDTYIIGASTAAIRNMSRVITSAGLQVDNLLFGPLASATALIDKPAKESGVILVDFGASTTSLIVFEEGDVIHATVLPVGSSHITNDIAIGLRTNLETAERIKQDHGYALSSEIGDKEIIDLSEYNPAEESTTSRKYVCEIIEARLGEIFSMIRDELRIIGKDGMLPAGVVFTGGGAHLAGLTDAAKDILQLPAQIGTPSSEISGMIDKLDDPLYSTSVGLMLSGLYQPHQELRSPAYGKMDHQMGDIFEKAKGFLKHLLP